VQVAVQVGEKNVGPWKVGTRDENSFARALIGGLPSFFPRELPFFCG
jgi:hypothetical protein